MRTYTAHTKPGKPPILIKEGWAWGAFLFGPLWFLARRAWIPAVLNVAILVLLAASPLGLAGLVVDAALSVGAGLLGNDLVRWSLGRRGYTMECVLSGRNADDALRRLLDLRPDIAAGYASVLA